MALQKALFTDLSTSYPHFIHKKAFSRYGECLFWCQKKWNPKKLPNAFFWRRISPAVLILPKAGIYCMTLRQKAIVEYGYAECRQNGNQAKNTMRIWSYRCGDFAANAKIGVHPHTHHTTQKKTIICMILSNIDPITWFCTKKQQLLYVRANTYRSRCQMSA
jgi:hypothetical protein